MAPPDWVTLTDGESVVWSGHPSLLLSATTIAAGLLIAVAGVALAALVPTVGLAALVLVPVGLLLVALSVLRQRATAYVITTEEVYRKRGILSRDVTNLRLDRVQNTAFTQSFGQRLLGIGNVRVDTAGSGGTEIVIRGVRDPNGVNAVLARQLDR